MDFLDRADPNASSVLIVDRKKILENYQLLLSRIGPAKIYPVVKANAYGLGMSKIASFLSGAGAEGFCVAHLDEAIQLRSVVPAKPIYVFYGLCAGQESLFHDYQLSPVLNTPHQVELWAKTSLRAALHVDTGLNRLGLKPDELKLCKIDHGRLDMVMSHLACGDEPGHPQNQLQLDCFKAVTDGFDCLKSLSASGGAMLGPDYHFDIVRAGIGLYGGQPHPSIPIDIKNPVSLYSKILQIKMLKPGDKVGYGATYTATMPKVIAILAYGYADGYHRSGALKGQVVINHQLCSILGRISMDLMAVDVTDVNACEGDWVELIGENLSLDKVAQSMSTISYEVITSLHSRAQRIYK